MAVSLLKINGFRNLFDETMEPLTEGLNLISGANGSGKTSILEAFYYLGLARSFRSSHYLSLIQKGATKFALFAKCYANAETYLNLGMERDRRGNYDIRLAEKNLTSFSTLLQLIPIRLINSQSHLMFEAGPPYRRKYLDWGLFYHHASFLTSWKKFERALKQRNALLKNNASKASLLSWNLELIQHANNLNRLRQDYFKLLMPFVQKIAFELLSVNLSLKYIQGWDESLAYQTSLNENFEEDNRYGYTQYGPHRADIDISIDGISVKHFLSRGQQKLLICAMIVAQGLLLQHETNKSLIYLIDDLPSELDLESKKRIISLLSAQRSQIFITAIESESITALVPKKEIPIKVFHVEHGRITNDKA